MRKSAALLATIIVVSGALALSHATIALSSSPSRSEAGLIPADELQQQVIAAERAGFDALKRGDLAQFANLTADEAVFVDDHGPADKTEVLKHVAGFTITEYSMEEIRFVPISSNTGLISYKCAEKGNSHGHDFSALVYVSSVWTKRGNGWVCLFSQETAVRKPPATTTPASH